MLKILGRVTSINVRKVLWALDEMEVSYEREDWGKPVRDPNTPEFLALNPNAQVPVIIDAGFVLWESHAVLRYLAERQGSDLWPQDARERGLVDQWMSWQSTELNFAWSYVYRALRRNDPPVPDRAQMDLSIQNWTKEMLILEAQLASGNGFVANGRFSLADVVIALSSHRWMSMEFERPELPAVAAHLEMMRARPAGAPYLGPGTP